MKRLKIVQASDIVKAGGQAMQSDVDGVLAMISHLSQGVPPRDRDLPRLSDLCKLVLKKAEDIYSIDIAETVEVREMGDRHKYKKLWGAEALKHTYTEVATKMAASEASVDLKSLKPLKQFIWLLDAGQREKVQEWVATLAKRFKATGADALSIADGDGVAGATESIALVSSASGSASVVVSSAVPANTKASSSKKATVAAEKQVDKKAMMLKFFAKAPE